MPCFLTISCRDFLLTLRISNEVKADLPVLFLLLLQVLGVYAFIFMFILPVCVVRSFLFILASDTLHCCVLNYMQFKLKNVRHFSHFTIVTLRDYIKMSWHPRPSTAMLTSPLVDHPTTSGNVVRADHERDGSIRTGRTTESPRRICGGVRRIVVTEEQRYGPLAGFALTTTTTFELARMYCM